MEILRAKFRRNKKSKPEHGIAILGPSGNIICVVTDDMTSVADIPKSLYSITTYPVSITA